MTEDIRPNVTIKRLNQTYGIVIGRRCFVGYAENVSLIDLQEGKICVVPPFSPKNTFNGYVLKDISEIPEQDRLRVLDETAKQYAKNIATCINGNFIDETNKDLETKVEGALE